MSEPSSADIDYETGTSNCCDAKVYMDLGICKECGEHCDVVDDKLQDIVNDSVK